MFENFNKNEKGNIEETIKKWKDSSTKHSESLEILVKESSTDVINTEKKAMIIYLISIPKLAYDDCYYELQESNFNIVCLDEKCIVDLVIKGITKLMDDFKNDYTYIRDLNYYVGERLEKDIYEYNLENQTNPLSLEELKELLIRNHFAYNLIGYTNIYKVNLLHHQHSSNFEDIGYRYYNTLKERLNVS